MRAFPLSSRLQLILVAALSCGLGGCGGSVAGSSTSTTPPAPPEVLYAQAAGEMSVFSIDASSGNLSSLQTLTLPGSSFSSDLGSAGIVATSPAKFLYSADSLDNEINAYSIAANGALSLVTGSPFAGNGSFFYITGMAVNPSGTALYAVSQSFDIVGFKIDAATGALTPMPSNFPGVTGTLPAEEVIDPSGQFLYVSSPTTSLQGYESSVSGFAIDATTGNLTPLATPEFGLQQTFYGDEAPTDITMDPTGKFLYAGLIAGTTETNAIAGFVRNATTGGLTPIAGSPFLGGPYSAFSWMAVHPSGKFLYSFNSSAGSISAFSIDASSGALSPVAGSPFAFPSGTVENEAYMPIGLDSSGKYLYSIGSCESPCLSEALIYNVNQSTGALSQASGSKKSLSDNFFTFTSIQAP